MGISIAITSGKGGAGASTIARNLAVFLAQVGKNTALVDLSGSTSGIEAFARSEGLRVIADTSAYLHVAPGLQNLTVYLARRGREDLWQEVSGRLETSEIEVIVVDARLDGSPFVFGVVQSCGLRMVVTTPDPTSVREMYACASAVVRDAIGRRSGASETLAAIEAASPPTLAGFASPRDLMEASGPGDVRDAIIETVRRMRLGILVNMVQEREDFDLGHAIESVGVRVFGLPLVDMGIVERDEAIGAAVRRRVPLLVHMPYSKSGRDLESLARRLLSTRAVEHMRPRIEIREPGEKETLYEVLEVDRGAGEHEIRKAERRIHEIYSGATPATVELERRGVYEKILEQAQEAQRTLLDRGAKREYDRMLVQEEERTSARPRWERPRPITQVARPVPAAPAEPIPDEGASGAWLASVRERRGMSIEDMSAISKVSVTYLAAIEIEEHAKLPERVYVRGFLVAYARTLGLDGEAVARSYLERMTR